MSNTTLIINMNILGANVTALPNESTKDFHYRMTNQYNDFYTKAKMITPASINQIKLCDELIDCGAPFPDLKETHISSMANADQFIKLYYHLLRNPTSSSVRVNNKNKTKHKFESLNNPNHFVYQNSSPSDYNIPNH